MDVTDRIKQQIAENDILLYMKGSPSLPQCGFSSRAAQILNACEVDFSEDCGEANYCVEELDRGYLCTSRPVLGEECDVDHGCFEGAYCESTADNLGVCVAAACGDGLRRLDVTFNQADTSQTQFLEGIPLAGSHAGPTVTVPPKLTLPLCCCCSINITINKQHAPSMMCILDKSEFTSL